MNEYVFKVIDAINRAGLADDQWGLVKDIDDTIAYFGTKEKEVLNGQ